MIDNQLDKVRRLCSHITCVLLGTLFDIRVERDNMDSVNGRIFIQMRYNSICTNNGVIVEWHGRKWYLSDHMTEDEIVKTCYCAFEAAVKHEIMEGFKFNGIVLFNPHVNYKELLNILHLEVKREGIKIDLL